jgi:hypothetical protein
MSIRRKETLVIVERDSGLGIEMREVELDGEKADVIFARSDGTEARVPLDPSKLRAVDGGQILVDFQYRGGVIKAPQQEVQR